MWLKYALIFSVLTPLCAFGGNIWESFGSEGFSAKASISSTKVEVPHLLELKLELTYPTTYRPNTEAIRSHLLNNDSIYPPFQLIKEENVDSRTFIFTLKPLIAGTYPLTFFDIPFIALDGKSPDIDLVSGLFEYTAVLSATEANLLPYTSPFLPLKTSLPIQISGELQRKVADFSPEDLNTQTKNIQLHAIPWSLLAAIFAAGIIYLLAKLAPRSEKRAPEGPKLSFKAHVKTEELFQKLKKSPSPALTKAYFDALIETIRLHLEEKYLLPISTQTSEEFLQSIVAERTMSEEVPLLSQFLNLCDRVKFGQYKPSITEIDTTHQIMEQIIFDPETK